jgi:hypothetical protein
MTTEGELLKKELASRAALNSECWPSVRCLGIFACWL